MKQLSCLFLLSIFLFSCEKIDVPDGTPSCVKQMIRKIEKNPESYTNGQKIERWDHEGKSYYLFPPTWLSSHGQYTLYDDFCHEICIPYGGITGKGSGDCPDLSGHSLTVIYEFQK